MTKILSCTCEHESQDKRYGSHKRVCNSLRPKQPGIITDFRCTVCGAIKSNQKD